jgi:hypothetical protein
VLHQSTALSPSLTKKHCMTGLAGPGYPPQLVHLHDDDGGSQPHWWYDTTTSVLTDDCAHLLGTDV